MPAPRRTATSAPMPFAQKPSTTPSASAWAAITPALTFNPRSQGLVQSPPRLEQDHAGVNQQPTQAQLHERRRGDTPPAHARQVTAFGADIRRITKNQYMPCASAQSSFNPLHSGKTDRAAWASAPTKSTSPPARAL